MHIQGPLQVWSTYTYRLDRLGNLQITPSQITSHSKTKLQSETFAQESNRGTTSCQIRIMCMRNRFQSVEAV